jgi:His/Glu/Gln/Arg/opine family amino acid ABC transporter permease subunit
MPRLAKQSYRVAPDGALAERTDQKCQRYAPNEWQVRSLQGGMLVPVFERYGIISVRALDELLDTVELLSCTRQPQIQGVAVGTDSGGECQLIVDMASDIGLDFCNLEHSTLERINGHLDPGVEASNPLDYWGDGGDVMAPCLTAMAEDPNVGMVVMATRSRILFMVVRAYVEFFRNTPPYVQLLFFYFGIGSVLPKIDVGGYVEPLIGRFGWAVISLSLFGGAFVTEIFRSGIESVPRAMREAAEALGYSRIQTFMHVVLASLVLSPATQAFF